MSKTNRHMTRIINVFFSIACFPLLVLITIVLLKKVTHPYLWFEPLWIGYFFYLSIVYSKTIKVIAFNLGLITLILLGFELGFSGLINFNTLFKPVDKAEKNEKVEPIVQKGTSDPKIKKENINDSKMEEKRTTKHFASDQQSRKPSPTSKNVELEPPTHQNRQDGEAVNFLSSEFFHYSSIYGFAPARNVRARYQNQLKTFDVINTIDEHGLRITPSVNSSVKKAILFFGDSFTYGSGVNDHEAFPYRVHEFLDHQYKVFNFAFHGWGPHQMLRCLETRTEEEVIKGFQPKYAFYLFYNDHIQRLAGNISWDLLGPRYELDENGKPFYVGRLRSMMVAGLIKKVVNKSHFLRWIHERVITNQSWDSIHTDANKDFKRFIAVVNQAKKIFEERYNGKFFVILWNNANEAKAITNAFQARKIEYIFAGDMFSIPLLSEEFTNRYKIEGDGHPNAAGHKKIASYLSKYIQNLEINQ